MKHLYKIFIAIECLLFCFQNLKAQSGLEHIIVEKYYVSNAADSIGSVGDLPVGSVTYRIFVDMHQGYTFQMAYGSNSHPLSITTTGSFFNNEDYGSITPNFSKTNAAKNTVMLDSWLSVGAACNGNFGILKSEDNTVGNVVNINGLLHNNSPYAGIPLTYRDGLLSGSPGAIGMLGLDTASIVFDNTSQYGNSFIVTNGAWFCLSGASGYDTTNKVLIAQITTKGILTFKLNIQLGTPNGNIEKYVAENSVGTEIQRADLIFNSDTTITNINPQQEKEDLNVIIFPNPSNGNFNMNISGIENLNYENYYSVADVLGNLILTKFFDIKNNRYHENINLSGLPKGIYFIKLYVNGQNIIKKIVIN